VARTFWALILRPGGFLRDYLAGKRVGFTQPVRYFFYAFILELTVRGILIWLTNDQQFADAGKFDLRHQIIDLVSTFFWGSLWWMFYRSSDLNFIEDAVCALYFIAQMNFYSVIFLLVSAPFTANRYLYWTLAIIELAITVGYSFYFARKLFSEPFWKLVPIQIVLTVLYVIFNLAFTSRTNGCAGHSPSELERARKHKLRRRDYFTSSKIPAAPIPPPTHIVTMP
jgi:hypothetical protein